MVAIRDFEMPESCAACVYGDLKYGSLYGKCNLMNDSIPKTYTKEMRYECCPLMEIRMYGVIIEKEDKKNIKHTCGRCKYEDVPPDCHPCNACAVYGMNHREDLWEEKEDD